MSEKKTGGSRQPALFARSKSPTIPIEANHRLVLLTDQTDQKAEQSPCGPL